MKVAPTRPATPDGCTIALAVVTPLTTTVIIALVTILIIIAKQLKDARYTLILKLYMLCYTTVLIPLCTCVHTLSIYLYLYMYIYSLHNIYIICTYTISVLQDSTWKAP